MPSRMLSGETMLKLALMQFLSAPVVENAPPGTKSTLSSSHCSSIMRRASHASGSTNQMNIPSVGTLNVTAGGRNSFAPSIIASRFVR